MKGRVRKGMFPFEHKREPLVSAREFRSRMLRSLALAGSVIGVSLVLGIAGYHWLGGLAWIDALVDASMILGGMGPVSEIGSTKGKLFASAYALYSGIALLTSVGVLFAPVVHRFLHHFHIEEEAERAPRGH
jgi:hypothetical protein